MKEVITPDVPLKKKADLTNHISSDAFSILTPQEEISLLKQGKIPTEVLYEGIGGELLRKIDTNENHIYTHIINEELWKMMFNFDFSEKNSPRSHPYIGHIEEWLDIGTGNGEIITWVAPAICRNIFYETFNVGKEWQKTHLICCDLSKASLNIAKELAERRNTAHQFNVEYYAHKFETFLSTSHKENPRLLTMFNVLANFNEEEMKTLLKSAYDIMNNKDIFIPTFFAIEPSLNTSQNLPGLRYTFRNLTTLLYNNKETQEWIETSFNKRYMEGECTQELFNVEWKNDGREYIEVSLLLPSKSVLKIGDTMISGKELPKTEDGKIKLIAFKSYRMSKKYLTHLLEEIGFGIDGRLESDNRLQIAPILYKKDQK